LPTELIASFVAVTEPSAIVSDVTDPEVSFDAVMPPLATSIVPELVIGPPVSEGPVLTCMTVPPSAPGSHEGSPLLIFKTWPFVPIPSFDKVLAFEA
jgi:hypothetical protein